MNTISSLRGVLIALTVIICGPLIPTMVQAAGGQLVLTVVDGQSGEQIPARIHLFNQAKRPQKTSGNPFWHDHFTFDGEVALRLPKGGYTFTLEHGPEYVLRTGHFTIEDFADDTKTVDLTRFENMAEDGWWSGDLDLHRNLDDLPLLMAAEGLHLAVVESDPARLKTVAGGQLARELPEIAPERFALLATRYLNDRTGSLTVIHTASAESQWPPQPDEPTSLFELAQLHRQDADVWIDAADPTSWDLPIWIAHNLVDSVRVLPRELGRERPHKSAAGGRRLSHVEAPASWLSGVTAQTVYFNLLNAGVRLPATAGSGSGKVGNPAGYNRMYVHLEGAMEVGAWWDNVAAGRTILTNGPLIQPFANGQLPGHSFVSPRGQPLEIEIQMNLATRDKIEQIEIIRNGEVIQTVPVAEWAQTGTLRPVMFEESGWLLVRVVSATNETYRVALSSPWFVEIGDRPYGSRAAAQFFLDWIAERQKKLGAAKTPAEQAALEQTIQFWQERLTTATHP